MEILILPRFVRQYKKLQKTIRKAAQEKEKIFRGNPFDPRLKTHKLSGVLEGYWAFSITHSHRIIFDFQDKKTVRFYQIGDHDIYW